MSEINSEKTTNLKSDVKNAENFQNVQTPQTDEKTKLDATLLKRNNDDDFLANIEAADPESFNVCISCD